MDMAIGHWPGWAWSLTNESVHYLRCLSLLSSSSSCSSYSLPGKGDGLRHRIKSHDAQPPSPLGLVASYPCQSAWRAGPEAELTLIPPGGPNVMRHSRPGRRLLALTRNTASRQPHDMVCMARPSIFLAQEWLAQFPKVRAHRSARVTCVDIKAETSASPQSQYLALREAYTPSHLQIGSRWQRTDTAQWCHENASGITRSWFPSETS
ncbi:uncharacterized protein B0H64DRAFT_16644 [Chaetomium fimeti]|uniref:Uncharacterized protein n=1 Tax=Chaetomium fimeti TaxID=1854472 RepID=A0AAE0HPR9_9PEZI|nr:hypothetical protein B0H64DRAFT_16644 [Chaetomium fimeti]